MGLRKGKYVGFWCPEENKRAMQEIAASQHRTLSQELNRMVEERVKTQRVVTTPARQAEERGGAK